MRKECGATAYLPHSLASLALHHLRQAEPQLASDPYVETGLECFLEVHAEGDHYGLVTDTAGAAPDVWVTWCEGKPPSTLAHLPACPRDNGQDGGLHDVCTLFTGHPGRCTFTPYDSCPLGEDIH
jgi:hypothetical protein